MLAAFFRVCDNTIVLASSASLLPSAWDAAEVYKADRSGKKIMLNSECLLPKICFDTAENEPSFGWQMARHCPGARDVAELTCSSVWMAASCVSMKNCMALGGDAANAAKMHFYIEVGSENGEKIQCYI